MLQRDQRAQLGPELAEHIRILPQNIPGVLPHQQPAQLRADPLRRHPVQHGPVFVDGPGGAPLNLAAKAGRKPQRPHHPQAVLLETLVRLTHAADQSGPDILRAAEGVVQIAPQIHGDGVHGEIPAGQILRQMGDKTHIVRPAAVGIGSLRAVGGDLVRLALRQHGDSAMLQSRLNDPLSGKAAFRLLRAGGGADVPVVGRHPPQQIPHAAAHQVGFVARGVQRFKDVYRSGGKFHVHALFHFSPAQAAASLSSM